ncbi:MAG: hypothetical protein R2909_22105 [Gemmatimonadales bacterium]
MPGVHHTRLHGWLDRRGHLLLNHNGLMKMYETQSGRDLDDEQPKAKKDSTRGGFHRARRSRRRPDLRRGGNLPTGKSGGQEQWP